jgi:hypothetical protein
MRILFDQGTPVPLREHLNSHTVATAFELGWSNLANGELIAAAEASSICLLRQINKSVINRILAGVAWLFWSY